MARIPSQIGKSVGNAGIPLGLGGQLEGQATSTRAIVLLHNDDFKRPFEFTSPNVGESAASIVGRVPGGLSSLSTRDFVSLGSLVSVTTDKSFGAASGTFSVGIKKDMVVFKSRSLLRELKDPEDTWIEIRFLVNGRITDIMLGLVDIVKETVQRVGEGQRIEQYAISGRDFGKVFEKTSIFLNKAEIASVVKRYPALYNAAQRKLVGNPSQFVDTLVKIWLGNFEVQDAPYVMPRSLGNFPFYQYLRKRLQKMDVGNGSLLAPALLQPSDSGTPLWGTLQEYANLSMNELWVDYQDLRPSGDTQTFGVPDVLSSNKFSRLFPGIFLRERPFPTRYSRQVWDALPTHRLNRQAINNRSITKGGAETRYNYWAISATGYGGDPTGIQVFLNRGISRPALQGHPGTSPIINTASIRRHGLRKFMLSTKFLPFVKADRKKALPENPANAFKTPQDIANLATNWLAKIHDWYSIIPLSLSGTLTTSYIIPEIRIGHRVVEERAEGNIYYYVEGVNHTWTYPGSGKTVLTVTRGEYEDENLLDIVYNEFDYDLDEGVLAIVPLGGQDNLKNPPINLPGSSVAIGDTNDGDGIVNPDIVNNTIESQQANQLAYGLPGAQNMLTTPVKSGISLETGQDIEADEVVGLG